MPGLGHGVPVRGFHEDFMKSLSRENQADIIEAFKSISRYLDDLLNIVNIYFDQMVDRIYPTELQLNRANSSDTITKTRLFKYIENFTSKTRNFQIKTSDIFYVSAQNIDCGYSLEPTH